MTPIFYSFRRCPYAMRARLALASSGVAVELREILLRDKPPAFLAASPSGTVPCLVTGDGVIDESLDIMKWALAQRDPEGWLSMPPEGTAWISRADGPFKAALDRVKYASRHKDSDPCQQIEIASDFLRDLDRQIDGWIFGTPTLADFAILPFVRQFAHIDTVWFAAQTWPDLQDWLQRFVTSARFEGIMNRYPVWTPGAPPVKFPGAQ